MNQPGTVIGFVNYYAMLVFAAMRRVVIALIVT
jgi:hypothetical protein